MNISLAVRGLLTMILLIGEFVILKELTQVIIPDNNKEIIYAMIGGLVALTTFAVNWWFGSSKGSSDKDKLLNGGSK